MSIFMNRYVRIYLSLININLPLIGKAIDFTFRVFHKLNVIISLRISTYIISS